MASGRSRSPSSPSEGEIIESESETKATTSQTSINGLHVDRRTRISASFSPRSPASADDKPPRRHRSRSGSRSRSRSPYRVHRGEKRRRGSDFDDRRYRHDSRRYGPRYDDRNYDSGNYSRRQRSYHDYDRIDSHSSSLHYNDDYDSRREKRQRTHSRSPYRDNRRLKQFVPEDSDRRSEEPSKLRQDMSGRRSSIEQSVSEWGNSPMVAPQNNQEAETRENQVQQDISTGAQGTLAEASSTNGTDQTANERKFRGPMDEAARLEARRKRREAIKAKYRDQATPLRIQVLQQGAETDSSSPSADTPSEAAPSISPHSTPPHTPGTASPQEFKVTNDNDLANAGVDAIAGVEKDEPSAADYDPTQDMREERERHEKRLFGDEVPATAYDETKTTKQDVLVPTTPQEPVQAPANDPYDMFADEDDMFAEDPIGTVQAGGVGPVIAKPIVPQAKELDMSMMDNWDDPEGYYNVRLGELINGRYHVQQNLGKGMFSSVVRATDSKTGKLVAIKIIRQNDTMRKAGMKEVEILQLLMTADPDDKKHLIRFERTFDHKGHLCMVFENLSMNLREVLKKFGRDVGLNLRAIRAYGQQMFLGLSLLRKCGILHADLKPDNLLVNEQRNVLKICDLGSASPASENEITPYLVSRFYRAPEIILGIPYDYAIDVWSIGCTLYELYTGKILFTGRNNNQMLRSMMECRGKFPPKLLRRGSLAHLHFDDLLNFQSTEEDKITGRVVTRMLDFKKPTRDLKTKLMGKGAKGLADDDAKELALFVDLLDRCLNLNPEKRCTVSEALRHPFFARK